MKIDNNLNTYSDEIIDNEHKKIIKVAIIFIGVFCVILSILSIFFNFLIFGTICFVIGGVISILLFYYTNKRITSSHHTEYKKVIKRVHRVHQFTYLISYVLVAFLTKSIWAIIGFTIGLFLIKISSLIMNVKK